MRILRGRIPAGGFCVRRRQDILGGIGIILSNIYEAAAVDWLNRNAQGAVVLAPAELACWLPGMAGTRVVYGHPMETPDADAAPLAVDCFYNSGSSCQVPQMIEPYQVRWIIAYYNAGLEIADGLPVEEAAQFGEIPIWRVAAD